MWSVVAVHKRLKKGKQRKGLFISAKSENHPLITNLQPDYSFSTIFPKLLGLSWTILINVVRMFQKQILKYP